MKPNQTTRFSRNIEITNYSKLSEWMERGFQKRSQRETGHVPVQEHEVCAMHPADNAVGTTKTFNHGTSETLAACSKNTIVFQRGGERTSNICSPNATTSTGLIILRGWLRKFLMHLHGLSVSFSSFVLTLFSFSVVSLFSHPHLSLLILAFSSFSS